MCTYFYVHTIISLMNVVYLPCIQIKNSVKERQNEIRSRKKNIYTLILRYRKYFSRGVPFLTRGPNGPDIAHLGILPNFGQSPFNGY